MMVYVTKADYILALTLENYIAEFYIDLDTLFQEEGFTEYVELSTSVVGFDIDWSLINPN